MRKRLEESGVGRAWAALPPLKRAAAGGSVLAVVVALSAMVAMANREPQALLLAGLSDAAAGGVATELDARGVSYTVRGNSFYVPAAQRDRLRLALAEQGLPGDDGDGYELLDGLSGFSTTADMFDAAYWRAKEGELARTIRAIPGVAAARVHLGVGKPSAFSRRRAEKTASVTIEARGGLNAERARSIQMLVALAVSGLAADQVAVIDTTRGLLAGPGRDRGPTGDGEAERAAMIEGRLLSLLEARVGPGAARVSVAVELDRTATTQTEHLVDPERQVARRLTTEERSREEDVGGAVTVASNLPTGDVGGTDGTPGTGDPALRRSVTREDVSYVGTQTERTTRTAPGALRRLSVAVLLDDPVVRDAEGGAVPAPRSRAELDALRELVASAAGLDEARGDTLTLRALPFEAPAPPPMRDGSFFDERIAPHAVRIAETALLGVVAVVLGLFVVKPLLTARSVDADEPPGPGALPRDAAGLLTVLVNESPEDAAAVLDAWLAEDPPAARPAA